MTVRSKRTSPLSIQVSPVQSNASATILVLLSKYVLTKQLVIIAYLNRVQNVKLASAVRS